MAGEKKRFLRSPFIDVINFAGIVGYLYACISNILQRVSLETGDIHRLLNRIRGTWIYRILNIHVTPYYVKILRILRILPARKLEPRILKPFDNHSLVPSNTWNFIKLHWQGIDQSKWHLGDWKIGNDRGARLPRNVGRPAII